MGREFVEVEKSGLVMGKITLPLLFFSFLASPRTRVQRKTEACKGGREKGSLLRAHTRKTVLKFRNNFLLFVFNPDSFKKQRDESMKKC